ncbi:MAG: ABC transporter substrate-binding protein [Acetobacteraceae bacterium]|nr:ABC transporter substrate-binding protein [Acetobacteraceae bacterium]
MSLSSACHDVAGCPAKLSARISGKPAKGVLKRRRFLAGSAASLAAPAIARARDSSVLKFVPLSDLPSLDPIWVPAYTTRAHAFMVFDTLYGQAGAAQDFAAMPQMVAGHTIENDGRAWTLTLRDGLLFHDGTKVLARDCVASIRRWGARDQFGQTLMQRTDTLTAPDDRTVLFRLTRPFPMLPDALGKFGVNMCPIMPERLANTDPFRQVTEVVGSGPFQFDSSEAVSGARYVYKRFARYLPREEGKADFISGPKIAHFDRIEWQVNPDQTSATEALRSGEIDWIEAPPDGVLPLLRNDPAISLQRAGATGSWGLMRPNCLYPPFDNPAIRRAVLGAIDQSDFMAAVIGPDPAGSHVPTGYFPPDSPMASESGLAALTGPRNLLRARDELRTAGYRGEQVVVIIPANLSRVRVLSEVAVDLLRKLGMNVDEQISDGASWARRLISKKAPDQGGWNIFCTALQGTDAMSPASHAALRGNGDLAFPGWPSSAQTELLRNEWLEAPDTRSQRRIAAAIQAQAFMDVPYYPLGTFYPSTAFRSNLTGILDGQAIFWNLRRTG